MQGLVSCGVGSLLVCGATIVSASPLPSHPRAGAIEKGAVAGVGMRAGFFFFKSGPDAPRLYSESVEVVLPSSFSGTHWVFVGSLRKGNLTMPERVWAIVDGAGRGDKPGHGKRAALPVIYSGDGGHTWVTLAPFPKPSRIATFDSLSISESGAGELRERLESDVLPAGSAAGRFRRGHIDETVSSPLEHGI